MEQDCKLQNNVEQIESNGGLTFILYPFGNLVQESLDGGFHVPIN